MNYQRTEKNADFEKQKKYYKRRMEKGGVEATVFAILKPLHTWEAGLEFKDLHARVVIERKKQITEARIRQAISMHNRFGYEYGIYIQSDYGWVESFGKKKRSFRYFVPKEKHDIDREHDKLDRIKDLNELKQTNLITYEEKVLPQEQQLEQLHQTN